MKELDVVRLRRDIPRLKLKKGQIGTIVHEVNPQINVVVVEFADKLGNTIAMEDILKDDLEII